MNQIYLRVYPPKEYRDSDWQYIIFQFNMNFSIDSLRAGYLKQKEKEKEIVSDDILSELGYSAEQILGRTV